MREPELGPGKLMASKDGRRTYRFASGDRSWKIEYCNLYLKPAPGVDDQKAAEKAKQVEAKRAGYLDPTPKAKHGELEAQLLAGTDDGAYLVYADVLQRANDPRGELIVAQAQLAARPKDKQLQAAEHALLAKYNTYFVPERLAEALRIGKRGANRVTVAWHYGFLRELRIAYTATPAWQALDLAQMLVDVLEHPSGRYLRTVVLGALGMERYDYGRLVTALGKVSHAGLRELVIGDFTADDTELASTIGVAPVLAQLPALERLSIRAGRLPLDPLEHPNLRALRIESGAKLDAVLASKLPALERLELLGTPDLAIGVRAHAKWKGDVFPALKQLVLHGTAKTSAILATIASSPLLKHLDSLDLTHGDLDADALRAVMSKRDAFAHLSSLELGIANLPPELAAWATENLSAAKVSAATAPRFQFTERQALSYTRDDSAIAAARKLAHADKWQTLGYDDGHKIVWGTYEGSSHYHVYASLVRRAHGCDCGSARRPCKHSLALLLLAARQHPFANQPAAAVLIARANRERPRYRPKHGNDEYDY